MAESLAVCNAAFSEFKQEYPDAAIYFCFLAGFNAGMKLEETADAV